MPSSSHDFRSILTSQVISDLKNVEIREHKSISKKCGKKVSSRKIIQRLMEKELLDIQSSDSTESEAPSAGSS